MAKKFLVNIDLGGNQLLNALVHQASSAPTAIGKGQLWFDTTNNQLNVYNGSTFQPLTTGGTAVTSLNSFTGGVNIYGTSNQVSVTNNTGSITLSLPSTVSVTTACATNFYGAFNGNATTVTNGVYTTDTGTVTSTMIANGTIVDADISSTAAIASSKLSASTVTIGSTAVGLGGTATTIAGLTKVTSASIAVSDTVDASSTTTGALTVAGGAGIAKNLYVGGNLDVSGSVYISGSAFTVSSSNITLNDPLLYLAHNNTSNVTDIGIVGSFTTSSYQHTGLVRDASDSVWKLFSYIIPEPTTTVNFASATYDTLLTGGLLINSSSITQTASISGAGALYAQSATFVGNVNLGSTVATGSVQFATTASNTSQTNFSSLTVGSVAVARKFAQTFVGDGASTTFTINHNLSTRDINARVYQLSSGPDTQYADIEVDIVRTSTSAISVSFATAPAVTSSYTVVVVG